MNNYQRPPYQQRPPPPPRNYNEFKDSKDLPDGKTSKNKYINGTVQWHNTSGVLCVKCGETGHVSRYCSTTPLPAWEQAHLRSIVFGGSPQANLASVGFSDDSAPYGSVPLTPSTSTSSSTTSASVPSSSVTFGFALLPKPVTQAAEVHSVDALLGEGATKRSRTEAAVVVPPAVPEASTNAPLTFQAPATNRQKKKGVKKVGKKAEPQPLIGLFNDLTGNYDKPISIRSLLRSNKIDMSLLDWMA